MVYTSINIKVIKLREPNFLSVGATHLIGCIQSPVELNKQLSISIPAHLFLHYDWLYYTVLIILIIPYKILIIKKMVF